MTQEYNEYYRIIEEAKTKDRLKSDNEYFERHHIIPKALGGTNSWRNLVLLTPEEHYICHSLLPWFCEGEAKAKMVYAWNVLNNAGKQEKGRSIIGPKKYGELKRLHKKSIVGAKHPGAKQIYQINRDTGKIVKLWGCASEAAMELNIDFSLISAAARGRQKTAKDFIWVFKKNFSPEFDYSLFHPSNYNERSNHPRARKIHQVDKDTGIIIKTWNCINDAALELDISNGDIVSRAKENCRTAGGYRWYYPENYVMGQVLTTIQKEKEADTYRKENARNCGVVYQIDIITNEIIKKWPYASVAARSLNIDLSGITKCVKGKQGHCGGYLWSN